MAEDTTTENGATHYPIIAEALILHIEGQTKEMIYCRNIGRVRDSKKAFEKAIAALKALDNLTGKINQGYDIVREFDPNKFGFTMTQPQFGRTG